MLLSSVIIYMTQRGTILFIFPLILQTACNALNSGQQGDVFSVRTTLLTTDNKRKPCHRKFISTHKVYLHGIWVKFIYEGHRVKVTKAKKVETTILAM